MLGKIQKVKFGMGGYQDAQFGISFSLGGEAWGTFDFWGYWADRSESAKWSEQERSDYFGQMNLRIYQLLKDAKASSIDQLEGIPIEAAFEDMRLVSWRVLKEVL